MSGIYSILGLQDGDDTFINTIGQNRVFDAAKTYLTMVDQEMMKAYQVFIQMETEEYKERYKLPGGGYMQERGTKAANAAQQAYGGWDVEYPLHDLEEPVAEDDTDVAYMTVQDVQLALDSIRIRAINRLRRDILRRFYNNTNFTFVDKRKGTLTIRPLANNDGTLYPPVVGADAEAQDDHYLESGYAASAISDTNNPIRTLRRELEEHFGTPQGFGNIAVFFNNAQITLVQGLTDFDAVDDSHKMFGANRDRVTGAFPNVPGRIVGRCDGAWVVEWDWTPAGYCKAVDLDQPAPMKVRRDPAATGIPRGLHLSGESDKHPLFARHYRNRYGVGTANRLNGVVMEFGTGGSYTIPAAYA